MSQFGTFILRKKNYLKLNYSLNLDSYTLKLSDLTMNLAFLQHRKEKYKFKHNSITYIVNTCERIWWM